MKKTWYKWIPIFVLVLIFWMIKVDSVYAEAWDYKQPVYTYGDFQYQYVKETDSFNIVGYTGTDEVVVFPGEIEGKPVYSISCSFNGSSLPREEEGLIKEMVIPYGVKEISHFESFENLAKIQIPETVETIGGYTFNGCTKLESVKLPEGLKSIDIDAFYDCKSLKEIEIPKGVSMIGELAFAGCSGLKKVTISPGVKNIGVEAFTGCTSLKEIVIPDSVIKIDDGAFYGCRKLTKVKLSRNLTTIYEDSFSGCKLKSIEIPKKVKKIEAGAFRGNSFSTVTIPSKVTYIGRAAFASCKKLKKITIKGSKLNTVKKNAFYEISPKATFDVPNKCIKKYTKLLKGSKSFDNRKLRVK